MLTDHDSSIIWAKPRAGGGAKCPKTGVSYYLVKSGEHEKTGAPRYQFIVFIQDDVMKKMRWAIGDKALVGYDVRSNMMLVKRDPDGFALSGNSSTNRHLKRGKSEAARIQLKRPDFIPNDLKRVHVETHEIDCDGLILRVPLKLD